MGEITSNLDNLNIMDASEGSDTTLDRSENRLQEIYMDTEEAVGLFSSNISILTRLLPGQTLPHHREEQ